MDTKIHVSIIRFCVSKDTKIHVSKDTKIHVSNFTNIKLKINVYKKH